MKSPWMSASLVPSKTRNVTGLEIGYWTVRKYMGMGIATLVTKILCTVGFGILGADRIDIGCNANNIASKKVIEKCGFVKEGEMRNAFSAPTEEMLLNGYDSCRTSLQYALLPSDLPTLPWYEEIRSHTSIH